MIQYLKCKSAIRNNLFLDILVKKKGKLISTGIYFKDTDSKQNLNFKSCHPKHTKTNIPFCLASRICTIVTDSEERISKYASKKKISFTSYKDRIH